MIALQAWIKRYQLASVLILTVLLAVVLPLTLFVPPLHLTATALAELTLAVVISSAIWS